MLKARPAVLCIRDDSEAVSWRPVKDGHRHGNHRDVYGEVSVSFKNIQQDQICSLCVCVYIYMSVFVCQRLTLPPSDFPGLRYQSEFASVCVYVCGGVWRGVEVMQGEGGGGEVVCPVRL